MTYLLSKEGVEIFHENSLISDDFVQDKVAENVETSIDEPLSKDVYGMSHAPILKFLPQLLNLQDSLFPKT